MTGDNQHFIPQSTLRGFKAPGSGKKGKVWVYRNDEPPRLRSIRRVAAGGSFYSSSSSVSDLDDKITRYENRIAALQQRVRDLLVGAVADAVEVAELIAHLTFRGEHIRSSISLGTKYMVSKAIRIFKDRDAVNRLIGLERGIPTGKLMARLADSIAADPRLKVAKLPREVIERLVVLFLKEKFPDGIQETPHIIQGAIAHIAIKADDWIRDGHNKALAASMVPDARARWLQGLTWTIEAAADETVLPDCIALGINKHGQYQPFPLADMDEIETVIMPLSSAQLVVGRAPGTAHRLFSLNLHAASCSENFFVAAHDRPELAQFAKVIGGGSWRVLSAAVDSAFSEYEFASPSEPVRPTEAPPYEVPPTENLAISFSFLGGIATEETAKTIAQAVFALARELSQIVPLNRLDGVTFAADYEKVLRDLDRGVQTREPLQTTSEPNAIGTAMSPTVLRDGVVKSHIIARDYIGAGLICDNPDIRSQSEYVIADRLVSVGCTELFDRALPGVALKKIEDRLEALRFGFVDSAWSAYLSSRICAPLLPSAGEGTLGFLISALERSQTTLPDARLNYRFDGDMDKLLRVSETELDRILTHAANLIGHADGLVQSPFDSEGKLEALLSKMNLRGWFDWYHRDLQRMWETRGRWKSFDEFLSLGDHAERLLVQFGMFMWRTKDGGCRVEVPLVSDMARLPKETFVRPIRLLRERARERGKMIGNPLRDLFARFRRKKS